MSPRREILDRDVYRSRVRLHEALATQFNELFKAHDLTQAQYNALRIVVGASPEGASCQEIGARLLTRVPDVTRLVDRMEASELVARERSAEDRRVVKVRATTKGKRLIRRLDEPVLQLHARQTAHLSLAEVRDLELLLRRAMEAHA